MSATHFGRQTSAGFSDATSEHHEYNMNYYNLGGCLTFLLTPSSRQNVILSNTFIYDPKPAKLKTHIKQHVG